MTQTAKIIPFIKPSNKQKCSFCGNFEVVIQGNGHGKICYKCVAHATKRLNEEV